MRSMYGTGSRVCWEVSLQAPLASSRAAFSPCRRSQLGGRGEGEGDQIVPSGATIRDALSCQFCQTCQPDPAPCPGAFNRSHNELALLPVVGHGLAAGGGGKGGHARS